MRSFIFLLILLLGCTNAVASQPHTLPPTLIEFTPSHSDQAITIQSNVLLITIDGTRWQDVFYGTDPALTNNPQTERQLLPFIYSHCIDHGMALGKTSSFIASNPAHISLPGYNEIAHGAITFCNTNECPQTTEPTFIDRLALSDTAVITSWEEIERAATYNPNRLVLNTGRLYRKNWKEVDNQIFPWLVGNQPYRSDPFTGIAANIYLHNHHPQLMWVGFGDTDEYAHMGQYPKYLASLAYVDWWLKELFNNEPDYMRNTDVIITADHGRGIDWRYHGWDKASEKDWLIMCGKDIPSWGFVGYTETKSLSNIAPTIEKLITGKQMIGSLL